MQPTQPETAGMSFHELGNTAMNTVEAFCSIIAMPVECLLRPWYGTRYYEPPIVFFSAALMILLPVVSAMITGLVAMIPFTHAAQPVGLFDIRSLAKLYFLSQAFHIVRQYRLMLHMERELCSTYEGPALPFFQFVPWSRSFWVTRCALEPAFVLLLAIVLQDFFIIQSGLATYLKLIAVALAMKNFISWYRAWEYLRDLLDARNAAPILARLVEDDASEAELSTIHLASFPKDVPPEIRSQAAMSIARAFSSTN